jgi:3-methyl-2-oxobutanoate hydroxymethyltransferase
MKRAGEKIVSLTAYDASFARVLDQAEVDVILVGDSLGMVVQGRDSTLPVRLDDMVYHSACVARGAQCALIMTDLPFMSYQMNREQALGSAGRLMQEGGAHMVKLEGGAPMVDTVRFLVERGIPVCAHLGLTPQSVHQLGGYRVQGREQAAAQQMRDDALAMQAAGASALLLEMVPRALAKELTAMLEIPTIGIGAGVDCDGQVLVLHDMLGIYQPSPKFAHNFLAGEDSIDAAVRAYVEAVRGRTFPGPEHGFD